MYMLHPVVRGKFTVRAKKKLTSVAPEVIFEGMHKVPELVEALKKNEERREKEHQQKMHEMTEAIVKVKKIQRGPKGDTVVPLVGVHFKQPKDGKDADEKGIEDRILSRVSSKIRQPKDGNDAEVDYKKLARMVARRMPKTKHLEQEPPSIKDIVSALKNLPEDERLTLDDLGNSEVKIRRFWERYPRGYLHGGGSTTIKAGSNIVVTKNSDGSYTISSTATGGDENSALAQVTPTGSVNAANTVFVADGQVILAGSDDGIDTNAELSFNSILNQTTITYSVPPQNNVFAFSLVAASTQTTVPTGIVNGSNKIFSVSDRVILAYADRVLDVAATVAFNPQTGISTITYSVPPQNDVSTLVSNGFAINQQIPSGMVNGNNKIFTAKGQVSVAYGDSGVDVDAMLTYNFAMNTTQIAYSVPPQNNVYAF